MPTWTITERDALARAVASGVLSVQYNDRSITYQSLGDMRALLADMDRQITAAPSYRLASTSKGV